jgi:trigger factor
VNVIITETSPTVRTLAVTIPQESLKAAFDKKVTEYRKEVQMKGFRPGQVPRNIIISRFGESLRHEAIDATINELVREELAKANIVPVARGQMSDFQDDKTAPITFKLTIEVDPPIDIQGYKETGITVPPVVVGEVEVLDELTHLRNMYAEHTPVDRAAQKGDFVEGKYVEVIIDGEERAVPANPVFRSNIGDSSTPGFDEGLVGAIKGVTKEILFTYPMDHKDPNYAGKVAKFTVEIDNVSESALPELNDEFAKKFAIDSLDALKEKIVESLSAQRTQQAKAKAQEEAIDLLIAQNPFAVAEARVKHWITRQLKRNEKRDEEEDEDQEQEDPTAEQMTAMGPQAIREIRKFRILEFIVKAESLKPTQADVDARVKEMALQYGMDFETLKASLRQSGRIVEIREDLKFHKAMDLIVGA